MAMTKKDYVLIAGAVKDARIINTDTVPAEKIRSDNEAIDAVARSLAYALRGAYSGGYSFDTERFLKACGVEERA